MALTALQAKAAKATDKPVKLSDGGGMFLLVSVRKNARGRKESALGSKNCRL